ncbi:MAG: hypothetical protein WB508_00585 [Aeromicrobium sp.]|uniref:hypothetical protein n=1 Tax=Aeromicrobium sp. TaxID=1871063 RepID=UPI003C55B1EB
MQLKEVFPGRPRLTLFFGSALAVAAVVLGVAAVVQRDPRQGAAAVVIAAFTLKETVVLPERVSQALGVVSLIAVVAWLALLFE